MDFNKKTVLVVGMARSGISSAKLLITAGARVIVNDIKKKADFPPDALDALAPFHIRYIFGRTPEDVLSDIDIMVLSPGVPPTLPFIVKARKMGKKVIGEIELGYLFSRAEIIAIGGTNGKTTTTALTGRIFKEAGRKTYVLGNIGLPIAEKALETNPGT